MAKIIESNIEGDKVYLKKDIFGWRVVQPIKVDGKFVWINLFFGGYRNLIFLLLLLGIAGFNMWSYNHDVSTIQNTYANISADPIAWCKDVNSNPTNYYQPPKINFTEFNPP